MHSYSLRSAPAMAVIAALAIAPLAFGPASSAHAAAAPSLLVTEIVPDTTGDDEYEFFEVTNTTSSPIDLDGAGVRFQYTGTSAAPFLTRESNAVIAPGASTVFWLSYRNDAGTIDSFARSQADFRAAFPQGAPGYDIVRVTGQSGMANGGGRGIRIVGADGSEISESSYAAGQVGENIAAHFGVPSSGSGTDAEFRAKSAPTPGIIDPAVLQPVVTTQPDPQVPSPGAPTAGAGDHWPLVVTEILPDTTGTDRFEFFEVANLSDQAVTVGPGGYRFAYTYVDSDDRAQDVALTVPAGTTIAAGGVTVFWIDYAVSAAFTETDFRTFFGDAASKYPIVRVSGQAGLSNGGGRGIRIVDSAERTVGWSYYAPGTVAANQGNDFRLPDTRGVLSMPALRTKSAPTPGVVAPEALQSRLQRPSDAELATADLQVTELLPDSVNVGASDGYEFIEVYNATDAAVRWEDFTIRYLYPLDDLSNSNTALWPSTPREASIPAGGTVVLWIKNGANNALTAADFNAQFGSSLTLGTDLLEIYSGGMANGSARGIEIMTNTEHSVNRAYYNLAGVRDVVANQSIRYGVNGDEQTRQALQGAGTPTPGRVSDEQVNASLEAVTPDAVAPTIATRTAAAFVPGEALDFVAAASDDREVRTVTLEVSNDIDTTPVVRNLVPDANGEFRVSVPAVDTVGKSEYRYRIIASDGTNRTDTGVLTVTSSATVDDVRLSVTDGQFVAGTPTLSAASDDYPSSLALTVDGAPFAARPELERSPVFAFEATATDAYFRNGVRLVDNDQPGDILTVFDRGFYSAVETVTSDIPLDRVEPGQSFAVRIYSGTKAAPEDDPNENNDDFSAKNLRLILPDGRTLRPAEGYNPDVYLPVGDGASAKAYYQATFTVPDDAFTAVAGEWDTRAVADGVHTVRAASATSGSAEADVVVDNTAPTIETALEERLYQGAFTIDATAVDAGSQLDGGVTATLDGQPITMPFATSSLTLAAAEHTVVFTAKDRAGNTATREVRFTTPVEEPGNELLTPADGATIDTPSAELKAKVVDPTGDRLDVTFGRGYELRPGTGVEASTGSATTALDVARGDAVVADEAQVAALGRLDGSAVETSSDSKLPYQLFRVDVPAGAVDGSSVRLHWDGSANAGAKVLMYVLDPAADRWTEVDRELTTGGAATDFSLEAFVPAADYAKDGRITVLVQHSEGFAGDDRSTRDSAVTPHHPGDVARSDYDFTLAWESDTQYYNASESIYDRQTSIHKFLLGERDDLNLQYLMHTGDIVDQSKDEAQWLRADPTYRTLDEAGLPYGVLAGNHDVDQQTNDYSDYSRYFGEQRFAGNPWYGGSHLDNRGHYDLITAGGVDFLMIYMGWAPGDEQIAWLNEVLAKYPERIAFLNLHEYMLTTGGLGPIPQRIYDEVVATNPNVRFVSSGHYHDAYTRLDQFDDDGDGTPDRTVTQMLFDYQGLPNGGEGFMRLLHFDNEGRKILVRTYSDYLKQYNSEDPSLELQHQQFEIPYAQAGIVPVTKTLAADAFRADVFTTEEIASYQDLESGSEPTATWSPGLGEHSWFVKSVDPYGATAWSEIRSITFVAGEGPGTGDPGTGEPGTDLPGTDEPGDGGASDGSDGGSGAPGSGSNEGTGGGAAEAAAGGVLGGLASTGPGQVIALIAGGGVLLLIGAGLLVLRRRRTV